MVQIDGTIFYVTLSIFFHDEDVFADAHVCEPYASDLFDICNMNLPDVPGRVKEILQDQTAFVIVKKTFKSIRIPVKCIKHPCVVYEFDETLADKRYLLFN